MIVTLAPRQIRTPERISNQCYCRLHHHISPRCLVFHCHCNRFRQRVDCMKGGDYCGTQTGDPKHHSCGGGGGCSHCGIGPQVSSPQLMSGSTGESSKRAWSAAVLSSAISRRCLSVLMQARSSLRNSIIVSRSRSLVAAVCGGRDSASANRTCD